MNKKIFSVFAVLTLAVGLFGFVAVQRVFAASSSTSTTISNVAPSIGTGPSDGGSDGTTPTNVGANVTFTATASDANVDQYYLAVCKTAAITAGASAAPTCTGGSWAISTATASGAQATVTYTALVGDAQSNVWYAYVCDGNGTPGLCSSVSQGAGSTGSPFNVNHAGTFGTVTSTDAGGGTIAPGDTIRFTLVHPANLADADTDTTQDTLTMHVCTAATTAYDYSANTCTNGATICDSSAVNPTTTDATCNDGISLTTVPTAHATYNYKVYVEDQHNFPASGTAAQTYDVIEMAPVITGWTTTDNINGTITAGGSDVISYAVAIEDYNGDNDISNVEGRFFDKLGGTLNTCTANEKNCYIQTSCTLGSVSSPTGAGTKTAMGLDKDLTADCSATVWFNANASNGWEFHVNPTDSGSVVTGLADTAVSKVVAALSAIGVTPATIAYGSLAVNTDSSFLSSALQNQGNQIIDVLVSGTNMTSGSDTIAAAQQKWNEINADFTWSSSGVALVTSASVGGESNGCLNRDLAVRAVHGTATEDESIAWKIHIPLAQASGSYTGTNTFATTSNSSCTGTLY